MKFKNNIIRLCALVIFLLICISAFALSVSAEEDGSAGSQSELALPQNVRVGDTFDLTLSLSTHSISVANGELTYDSERLEFVGARSLVENWIVTTSQGDGAVTFLAIDILLSSPIEGELPLVAFTFSMKEGALESDEISFTCGEISVSDGVVDSTLAGATSSVTVQRPLSGVASLSSLSVNGAHLTPAFDSAINSYSLTVDNSVTSLDVAYTCDELARVEIIGNELNVGDNTVIVRVWSEDGNASTDYELSVKREHPDDYKGASDSSIGEITLSSGHITPAFAPDVFEYVIYITDDVSEVTISGQPSVSTSTVADLTLDLTYDGAQKLICTSEDGTVTEYLFTVRYIDEDDPAEQGGNLGDDNPPADTPNSQSSDLLAAILEKLGTLGAVFVAVLIAAIAVTAFFVGFIIAFAFRGKKKKRTKKALTQIPSVPVAMSVPEDAGESAVRSEDQEQTNEEPASEDTIDSHNDGADPSADEETKE